MDIGVAELEDDGDVGIKTRSALCLEVRGRVENQPIGAFFCFRAWGEQIFDSAIRIRLAARKRSPVLTASALPKRWARPRQRRRD